MNAQQRLLIFGVSAARWTARYGVLPFSHPCLDCGRILTTTIPFVQGSLRGLQAPTCECGNEQTPFGLVRDPAYGDLFTGREVGSSKARACSQTTAKVVRLARR